MADRRTFIGDLTSLVGTALFWPKWARAAGLYNVGAFWRNQSGSVQTLWAWGADNSYGELASTAYAVGGIYVSPVQIAGSWTAVSGNNVGYTMTNVGCTYGIRSDGSLWSWGVNPNGNLGPQIPYLMNASSPMQIPGYSWSQVSANIGDAGFIVAAIRSDGTLWVVGDNYYGECGVGSTTVPFYSSPVQIGSASTWSHVAMGGGWWIATQSNGTLWGCGQNDWAQLNSTKSELNSATQLLTGFSWTQVSCGISNNYEGSSFAIRSDGTLWAGAQTEAVSSVSPRTRQDTVILRRCRSPVRGRRFLPVSTIT